MISLSQIVGAYLLTLLFNAPLELHADPQPAPTASLASAPRSASSTSATPATLPRMWAGHQVMLGQRTVPLKGTVQTRTDTFVIAQMSRDGELVEFTESACRVRFSSIGGVTVSIDAEAIPPSRTVYVARDSEPDVWSGRSVVGWSTTDIDNDGHPGMTVRVRAPVCSGELYVSNQSRTRATATLTPERLEGRANVRVRQSVLGARGACLSAVAEDTDERQAGPFAYVPVDDNATCASLMASGWPVSAG